MQDEQQPEYIYAGSWYTQNPDKNAGLFRFNIHTNQYTFFTHNPADKNSISSNDVWKIKRINKNQLLIGTAEGLSFYTAATQSFINYTPADNTIGETPQLVKDIVPDGNGNFWCESGSGLLYFNTAAKQFKRYSGSYKTNNGIMGSYIHNLLLDKTGTLWFGIEQSGLQWLNITKSKFIVYQNNPNLTINFPGGALNSIAQAKDSSFWIGSNKGLYNWLPAQNRFTQLQPGNIKDATVISVITDKQGLIWFRAYGGVAQGVYAYNPATKQLKNFRHKDGDSTSLASDNIQHIAEDSAGNIWLGSAGYGVSRIDKQTQHVTNYPFIKNSGVNTSVAIKNGWLDDDEVQSIYVDKQGTVYVGTNNGSLNIFDARTGKFNPVNKTLYSGLYCVISIFKDRRERLWAGTYMTGIYYRQNNSYKKFSEADSLLYNGSWAMNEDGRGNLWSLSPRGLTIIDSTGKKRNITSANGLPDDPNYFILFKALNGNFYYSTKDGFVEFNPADFTIDTITPALHIESVVFNRASSASDSSIITFDKKQIQLRYNENRVTFNYIGLQYQNTATIQYAYKLDGYDDDWINAGTDRNITYTNLSPGTYVFHVKAANSDGVWTAKDESVTVIITPPWWQTWWAYLLYIVIFVAVVYMYITYRSKKLTQQNKLLEDKVTERTSQLNQSLQELKSTQAQLIQSEKMASLGELTAGIAHEIQNPLNFVTNFSEVSSELISEIQEERNKARETRDEQMQDEILSDIKQNLEKINHHGKRADAIVKGMLQHSRSSTGQKEPTDINALCDEYLRLSYHGLRAKDKTFNADFKTDFDETIGKINIVPQDVGRVLL